MEEKLTNEEINALIHEKVFDAMWLRWSPRIVDHNPQLTCIKWLQTFEDAEEALDAGYYVAAIGTETVHANMCIPKYSESVEFAWKIVERLRGLDWRIDKARGNLRVYCYRPPRDHDKFFGGDSLPRAICLAALSALGENK